MQMETAERRSHNAYTERQGDRNRETERSSETMARAQVAESTISEGVWLAS